MEKIRRITLGVLLVAVISMTAACGRKNNGTNNTMGTTRALQSLENEIKQETETKTETKAVETKSTETKAVETKAMETEDESVTGR